MASESVRPIWERATKEVQDRMEDTQLSGHCVCGRIDLSAIRELEEEHRDCTCPRGLRDLVCPVRAKALRALGMPVRPARPSTQRETR